MLKFVVKCLEGAWVNVESDGHYYAKLVNHELIVPYCLTSNDRLTGAFFDWQLRGKRWFSRFRWIPRGVEGFALFEEVSPDRLVGEYWRSPEGLEPASPPSGAGVRMEWQRRSDLPFAPWATEFLEQVQQHGLPGAAAWR